MDEIYVTEYNVPENGSTVTYGHYFGRYDLGLECLWKPVNSKSGTTPVEFGAEYVSEHICET